MFIVMKYNLKFIREDMPLFKGQYDSSTNIISISNYLNENKRAETIAHELGHFFYQHELNKYPERLTLRLSKIDVNDQGALLSEVTAHIIGHYGAEIQTITNKVMESLW